jgi:hypothetical protein
MEVLGVVVATIGFLFPMSASAVDLSTTLATPVIVSGEVQSGDIISYDPASQTYQPSATRSDETVYGVVVADPVLYMDDREATGTEPVIRFGETLVNVSDWNGPVSAGDLVTTSHLIGVGQLLPRTESGYIVGLALTDAEYGTEVYQVDGQDVRVGEVLLALRIGYTEGIPEAEAAEAEVLPEEELVEEETGYKLIRYLLGSVVIILAIVFVLRRFADLFAQSIVSVGRNPTAHTRIRSILIWNAILIVIIGGMGIGIGVTLIVL